MPPDPRSSFQSSPATTAARVSALSRYFDANVLTASTFICRSAVACRASHTGMFYEGQLHHVGSHYDLTRDGEPFRVVVVGQEYGHEPPLVTLERRHAIIVEESGARSRFKAEPESKARNPHMKGCTSLLRLLFGLGLGTEHADEYVDLGEEAVHIFECFALVNFLLCSAVPHVPRNGSDDLVLGGKPGRSTSTMRSNCTGHFRAVLDILQPTIVVAQGFGVRRWIARTYGLPLSRPADAIERLPIGDSAALLIALSHPSARGKLNWGSNERTPYLLEVVAPTVKRALSPTAPPT